ncbi:hypothetical protein J132_07472 [Termitomyces sp. J132]|nr:hypothetical protein J132_07472 [Termitomyces sp. J132]
MLTNRKTRLKFDNFISELFEVLNGTTQGCPLTMLFYAFYNTPLMHVALEKARKKLEYATSRLSYLCMCSPACVSRGSLLSTL